VGDDGAACPAPVAGERVTLAHGGGGRLTRQLVDGIFLPAFADPELARGHDGAVLEIDGARIAFTTDSFVMRPARIPGADLGTLAVCGTVNDLAMCGARPVALSTAFILEEGAPLDLVRGIAASMAATAREAGVRLVTGDTKVVDRAAGESCYVTTSGIGAVPDGRDVDPARICPGDALVLSGDLARHGMAVLAAREGLAFDPPLASDCAPLHREVEALYAANVDVRCLRDCTRGGLAAAAIECAGTAACDLVLDQAAIPIDDRVRGACEVLGIDPLHVACEGRFLAAVPAADAARARAALGEHAAIVGHAEAGTGRATLATAIGARRVLHLPTGEQLPRIC